MSQERMSRERRTRMSVASESGEETVDGSKNYLSPSASDRTPSQSWGLPGTAAATIAAQLSLENITRSFGDHDAVYNFSLDIAPGEIVCLLGPSGCGKTTLLRIASGIDRPTSGRVLQNNQEISGADNFVLPEKRNIGLMFQDFALFPHLTVLENVAFGLKDLSTKEAAREARSALERVGLLHYEADYPHILSGGQQQRVALARAIAPRPGVLLMDEPFSGLDSRLRDMMRKETLAVLRETRATCIIVTHNPEEAMRLGDRIAVMRNGSLVQVGTAEELYRFPKNLFVAQMFSEMNEFPGVVRDGKIETPIGAFDADDIEDGRQVILCVRHRAVKLVDSLDGHRARILHVKFLGDTALLELAVEGLNKPLLASVLEQNAPSPGTDVGITIDPNMVLVLEREGDTPLP